MICPIVCECWSCSIDEWMIRSRDVVSHTTCISCMTYMGITIFLVWRRFACLLCRVELTFAFFLDRLCRTLAISAVESSLRPRLRPAGRPSHAFYLHTLIFHQNPRPPGLVARNMETCSDKFLATGFTNEHINREFFSSIVGDKGRLISWEELHVRVPTCLILQLLFSL